MQEGRESFIKDIEEKTSFLHSLNKKEAVRVVSHLDADGISAAAIMVSALGKENLRYSVSIVQQLTNEVIKEISFEPYKTIIFCDLGSGQIDEIIKVLKDKSILILDHHQVILKKTPGNIVQVNPHLHGIDGTKEISGSGVVYLFAKAINAKNEKLAHLAVIGAIGDMQERKGELSGLNRDILETAVKHRKIIVTKGLRLFGSQTRPLHKLLEYSTDPYIPGVTGSESGAIKFLSGLGIRAQQGTKWRKLVHLDEKETQKLVAGIVMKRAGMEKPEDIIGNVYILPEEDDESPTRDTREFSTLLNACGRLGKASLGIGICLGDKKAKQKASRLMLDYKREIIHALEWYHANEKTKRVIKGEGYVIINAQDDILPTVAGTLASILSRSGEFKEGTLVLSLAQLIGNKTKVSIRMAGSYDTGADLREIIKEIADSVKGESGGHSNAAGAVISTDDEDKFIKTAKVILEKRAMEETVK